LGVGCWALVVGRSAFQLSAFLFSLSAFQRFIISALLFSFPLSVFQLSAFLFAVSLD
jgi:hypothetical protein